MWLLTGSSSSHRITQFIFECRKLVPEALPACADESESSSNLNLIVKAEVNKNLLIFPEVHCLTTLFLIADTIQTKTPVFRVSPV